MSTEQDSNLHPLVSGWVPLPLDHLHSCFLLLFNSYPRAFLLCLIQDLDTAHAHYMHRVLWDANAHAHQLLREDASCACASVNCHHLPHTFLKLLNLWIIINISLEQFYKQEKFELWARYHCIAKENLINFAQFQVVIASSYTCIEETSMMSLTIWPSVWQLKGSQILPFFVSREVNSLQNLIQWFLRHLSTKLQ